MLIRIVRMTFAPEYVEDFLAFFGQTRDAIQNSRGCRQLELWQDTRHPNILMTYSRWESESQLETYRQSDLFKETWKRTKNWFAAPPQAWSARAKQPNTIE